MDDEQNPPMFTPPWWLRNRHMQSLFNVFFSPSAKAILTWEELKLPDGDFLDLCWAGEEDNVPIIILLHGLEGSVNSHYIQTLLDTLVVNHYRVVVMHFRSCSGRLNRLPKSYHAGEIGDLNYLLQVIQLRYPKCPVSAVGFSLGGNVLLNYLIYHPHTSLDRGIAVSVPFDLTFSENKLPSFYQWAFIRTMKQKVIQKINAGYDMPVTLNEIKPIVDFYHFDNIVTAPLHGFCGVEDYYESVSVKHNLKKIQHATLIIHALDDPMIPPETIPKSKEISKCVNLEIHPQGGHVGFTHGMVPWHPVYWLNDRILKFLQNPLS